MTRPLPTKTITIPETAEQREAKREAIGDLPLLPDGSLDTSRSPKNLFDDVFDNMHSTQGSAAHMSADDREATIRWEQNFLFALKAEVTGRLLPSHGIKAVDAHVSDDGTEYKLRATDAEGRQFDVAIGVGEMLAFDEAAGRETIDTVCGRILESRKKWFYRMGSPLS